MGSYSERERERERESESESESECESESERKRERDCAILKCHPRLVHQGEERSVTGHCSLGRGRRE